MNISVQPHAGITTLYNSSGSTPKTNKFYFSKLLPSNEILKVKFNSNFLYNTQNENFGSLLRLGPEVFGQSDIVNITIDFNVEIKILLVNFSHLHSGFRLVFSN